MKRDAMRKPPHRAASSRPVEHLTTNQIIVWLDARLAADPKLRRAVKHVLAALQKAAAARARRRRRAG
jgi:hypothetical protein